MPSAAPAPPPPPPKVFIVLWRDAASSDFVVLGAYASLPDANAEARRLGREQLMDGLAHDQSEALAGGPDTEPVRWDTADGVSCWVEEHEVERPSGRGPRDVLVETPTTGLIS